MRKLYFDYAATTPMDFEVLEAMKPYFAAKFGNAGSLHWAGQEAQAAIDISRKKIADFLGTKLKEIIFTGSATEANNLVLKGVVSQIKHKFGNSKPHILVSVIEHDSVIEAAKELERGGVEVEFLKVDDVGLVDKDDLLGCIKENTVLVSIGLVNNEIGAVQPIKEIGDDLKEIRGKRKKENNKVPLYFHTDAVQAVNYLPIDVENLGVDFLTLSAHKAYGPKGIGLLYVKEDNSIDSLIDGGGQEYGLRSGTENVPAIVGFARALELVKEFYAKGEAERVEVLRDELLKRIKVVFPKVLLNGPARGRIANNLNIALLGVDAQEALVAFDLAGAAISIGSACSVRARRGSHVLKALGFSRERIDGSVRISLGRQTDEEDIEDFLEIFKNKIILLKKK
jgi:cysteine desulfurase